MSNSIMTHPLQAAAPLELDGDKEFGKLSAAMKRSSAATGPQQANGRSSVEACGSGLRPP